VLTILTWGLAGLAVIMGSALGAYFFLASAIGTAEPASGQSGRRPDPSIDIPRTIEKPSGTAPTVSRAGEDQTTGAASSGPANPTGSAQSLAKNSAATQQPVESSQDLAILPDDTAVEVRAFEGEPFGVGKITVDFPESRRPKWHADRFIHLEGPQALYPAFDVRYAVGSQMPRSQVDRYECYFLFRGHNAFEISLAADTTYPVRVVPTDDPKRHGDLLRAWWRVYRTPRRLFSGKYDQSSIVHDYVTDMLARRLKLLPGPQAVSSGSSVLFDLLIKPLWRRLLPPQPSQRARPRGQMQSGTSNISFIRSRLQGSLILDFDRFLGLLFGTESIRLAFQTDKTLVDAERSEMANLQLPQPMTLPPVPTTGGSYGAEIEPIAFHVPQECFYLRCRSLAEYLWLRALVVSWGGSFNDLISTDAVDHQIRPRIERQLAFSLDPQVRENLDDLISDMALIGTDVLFRDGAALGVVFQSRDGVALERLIRRQREKTERECPEATAQKKHFRHGIASFLATPDNRVRSFYAVDGDYHLVTNSAFIAERFFELDHGKGALGSLREFRYARSVMPLARNDAVFIYLSDPFFRLIVGPQYRIEMTRRAQAIRDWRHVYLARLAAQAEGAPSDRVESLIEAGFLPTHFLRRPDGSRPVLQNGIVYDSLRGALGTFLPIPDVEVTRATRSEVKSYQRFASHYRTQWRRMDPVSVGIQHEAGRDGRRERVLLDIRITPYARANYERLYAQLDPPDQYQLAPVRGDVMRVEARLRSFGCYLPGLRAQHPRAYGALRDFVIPYTVRNGKVETVSLNPLSLLGKDYQSYAGVLVDGNAWSNVTGDRHKGQGDLAGYSFVESAYPALLSWRRTLNRGWVAWSQRKGILEEVTPQLRLERADRPAQVRFRLGDLAASKLGPPIQAICYMHARRISALNAGRIHQVIQQFKVKPEEARRVTEELLGARLACPLGGEYQLTGGNGAPPTWKSTAWQRDSIYIEDHVPEDYCYPFLGWLRGALMELTLDRVTLSTHVELEVKPSADSGRASVATVAVSTRKPTPAPVAPPRKPITRSIPSPREPSDDAWIRGTWRVVEDQKDGKPFPGTIGLRLRFQDGELLQIRSGVPIHRFRYRLHPGMQPKGFDFLPKGRQIWDEYGIYQLQDNRLALCYGYRGAGRPTQFDTNREDSRRLVVLERVDAGDVGAR
jgi:uncharacterized protein (TIGR03067 family)